LTSLTTTLLSTKEVEDHHKSGSSITPVEPSSMLPQRNLLTSPETKSMSVEPPVNGINCSDSELTCL
jgi:hypothetical protein